MPSPSAARPFVPWHDVLRSPSMRRLFEPFKKGWPRWMRVRQNLPGERLDDPAERTRQVLQEALAGVRPGMRIGLTAGSRGIDRLAGVLRACIDELRNRGAEPFIIAAMGSHGGGTPRGQAEILASYGITPETMGVPIDTSMDVRELGRVDGMPVYFSEGALAADGIIAVGRVKPHTSFRGRVESGLCKMLAVGLGKHVGAQTMHAAGMPTLGERVPAAAAIILERAPVLGGLALIENGRKQLAHVEWVPADRILTREPELLEMAWKLMPRILTDELDVLIVDEAGKNISGTGMDPNVTGRFFMPGMTPNPWIRRIVLRSLTPESHGNFNGLTQADIITHRVVEAMDFYSAYTNSITSTVVEASRIPFIVATDEEAIGLALHTCRRDDPTRVRLARVKNTSSLEEIWISEALWEAEKKSGSFTPLTSLMPMAFSAEGDLLDEPEPRAPAAGQAG